MDIIAQSYCAMVRAEYALAGRRFTKHTARRCRSNVETWLTSGSDYTTQHVTNGILDYFLACRHAKDDSGKKRLQVFMIAGERPVEVKDFLREIGRAKAHFKEKRVGLLLSINQEPLRRKLERCGYGFRGYELMGHTGQALSYLYARAPRYDNVRIEPLQFPQDRGRVIDLNIRSFRAEPSANTQFGTAAQRTGLADFLTRCVQGKLAFKLTVDDELIGVVGLQVFAKIKTGYISTIAIDPDFQGQGLGLLLYQQAMREFRRRGVPYYLGNSSTAKVLRLAPKMGRARVRSYSSN